MATVRFLIDQRGTSRRTRKLYASITTDHGRFKHYPNIEVDPQYWREDEQRLVLPKKPVESQAFNVQLEAYRARVMAHWMASGGSLAKTKQLLKGRDEQTAEQEISVQQAIRLRLEDRALTDSPSTQRAYDYLCRLIDQLNHDQPLPLSQLTYTFYTKLQALLVNGQGNINSSANRYLSKLKTSLTHVATRHTEKLGEELAGKLLGLVPRLDFLEDEEPDIIAPELEDVLFLSGLHLDEEPELQLTRDRYVFACFTGPRHSDINNLEGINLAENEHGYHLRYMPIKTKRRSFVEVPVNRFAYELLQRNLLPDSGLLLPAVDNRRDNENLHRLLRDFCGQRFHNLVSKVSFQGGKRLAEQSPRWQAITFHTSRHFFAVTLINLGVPLQHVQELLGQRNLASTLRYAKSRATDVQQSARLAFGQLQLPSPLTTTPNAYHHALPQTAPDAKPDYPRQEGRAY